ncbi:MAG: PH domain-containing protein [Thermoplasmata archaeon]
MQKPKRKMKTVWIISWLLGGIFIPLFFIGPITLIAIFEASSGISLFWSLVPWIVFLIVYGMIVAIGAHLYYKSWWYALDEDYIVLKFGILWKKTNRIPYARIQNVNVVRGPLLRLFGLCKVHVETAGKSGSWGGWSYYGSSPEGWIPGPVEGEKITEEILKRVKEQHDRTLTSGI